MNTYFFGNWEDVFLSNVRNINGTLVLVSPSIKFNIIKKILSLLNKNHEIKLIIISRFNKKVFKEKKSDLNLYDFLINNEIPNFKCQCYNYDNLSSNIYMFDSNYMFLGSSTLSKQGLIKEHSSVIGIDSIIEIDDVKNEVLSLIANSNIILNKDIIEMKKKLCDESYESFKKADTFIEEDNDPLYKKIGEIITSSREEKIIDINEQISYNEVIESYKHYKNSIDFFEFYTLNEENLNTLSKEFIITLDEDEAKKDYEKLKNHVINTFSSIIPIENNIDILNDIINCFIHSSWQHKFKSFNQDYSNYKKELFNRIGQQAFSTLIAISITKSRLFQQGKNQLFDNTFKYMISTYPYLDALKSIKCDVFLFKSDISKNIVQNIFYELMGVLSWHLGFKIFDSIFINHFDYTDEYVYDEYKPYDSKSLLQELTQQNHGLPEYIEIAENGPDHKKTFVFQIKIDNKILSEASGNSKKDAQEKAAKLAINNFIKNYSYIKKEIIKSYDLKPYKLDSMRKIQLNKLNKKIPKPISNLALLDISFTHISIIKRNSYSRSNDALSFLGSILELYCRKTMILSQFTEFNEYNFNKYIDIEQNTKTTVTLKNYFDRMNFETFLQSSFDEKKIPDTVKLSCIQSLISLFFLEYGLDDTLILMNEIWADFKLDEEMISYTNIVQNYVQDTNLDSKVIQYKLISETGKDNNKTFEIGCFVENIFYGSAKAGSKKEAKRLASKETYYNPVFINKFINKND